MGTAALIFFFFGWICLKADPISRLRKLLGGAFVFVGGVFDGAALVAALIINLAYGSWLFLTGEQITNDVTYDVSMPEL